MKFYLLRLTYTIAFSMMLLASCNMSDCDHPATNEVSVSIENKSSQAILSLELFQGMNHTQLGRLELNQQVCFTYTCAGESSFRLFAILQSGDTLLSENYAEGGYQLHLMIEDYAIKSSNPSLYDQLN